MTNEVFIHTFGFLFIFLFFIITVIIAIDKLNDEVIKKPIYFYEFAKNNNNSKAYISKDGKHIFLIDFRNKVINVPDTKIPVMSSSVINMLESGHAESNNDIFQILIEKDLEDYFIYIYYDY